MPGALKNEHGFTLIELVIIVILLAILAVAVTAKYVDLTERVMKVEAKALLETGRATILLDFSDKVLNTGQYLSELTDATAAPGEFDLSDVTDLESELQSPPRYPPKDRYNHPPNKGFRWYLVTQGSTASWEPPTAPTIDALIDATCDPADSAKGKKNDDCFVSVF